MIRVLVRALGVCVAALLPSVATADTGFLDRSITMGAESYRYLVYVPIAWTRVEKWPVIVSLHGNGSQGTDGSRHLTLSGGGSAAPAAAILADRDRCPAIVLFPQARPQTRWSSPLTEEMVMTAIDATMREFNGDTDRLYFLSHSMAAALKSVGADVRYSELTGLSHLETAIKVANDKEILKWLLAQRRMGRTN